MLKRMFLTLSFVLCACPAQQPPPPPPGMVMGPNGVMMPGISVTPNGVQMPGISVTPGGVQMPGISVTPQGVQMPGVAVTPTGVQAPGFPFAVPPAGAAQAPTGVAECDQYVQRACACSNEMARGPACMAATTAAGGWRMAIGAGAPPATIAQSCMQATASLAATCP